MKLPPIVVNEPVLLYIIALLVAKYFDEIRFILNKSVFEQIG